MHQRHLVPDVPTNQYMTDNIVLHLTIDTELIVRVKRLVNHILNRVFALFRLSIIILRIEQLVTLQRLKVFIQFGFLVIVQRQLQLFSLFEVLTDKLVVFCTQVKGFILFHRNTRACLLCRLGILRMRQRLILFYQLLDSLSIHIARAEQQYQRE